MTRPYRRVRGLSLPQRHAVELELEGRTSAEIAAAVGVSPGTVRNWRSRDLLYRTTMNREMNEWIDARKARIEQLDHMSLDVIHNAMRSGDVATALRFHALHAGRSFRRAFDDLNQVTREAARRKLHESMAFGVSGDSATDDLMANLMDQVTTESNAWEREALDALDSVRVMEDMVTIGNVDLSDFLQATSEAVNALQVALVTSEGEGARSLAPSTAPWQARILLDVHDKVHNLLEAEREALREEVPSTGFRNFARATAETLRLMIQALSGVDPITSNGHPFAEALVEANGATVALESVVHDTNSEEGLTEEGLTEEELSAHVVSIFQAVKETVMLPVMAVMMDSLTDQAHAAERPKDEQPPREAATEVPSHETADGEKT